MWLELTAAAFLLAGIISTTGWLRTRRRLADSAREREDLANSTLVIEVERKMLELVAKGAPLGEVLNTLTMAIERISPGALCSIMLLDEEHRRFLSIASGPSLPLAYVQALNGLEIGANVGACGTAAFRNETVVVEDIATDEKFAVARDFVLSHGVRSVWSQPVRDSSNNVLGTFAVYHRHVTKPRSEELRMTRAAAQLTGNAIERIRAEKALNEATKRLNLAEKVARFGIWEANYAQATIAISEGMAAIMERSGENLLLSLPEFDKAIHPDDLRSLQTSSDPENIREGTIQDEFRLILPSGAVRWMRSNWRFELTEGRPTRATGAMIDITEEKRMLVQSQEAREAAESAARLARAAERLEQDRKTILEMVAKDQPLERIVTNMAGAVASHLPGSLCAIQIELPADRREDASHISVYPEFPEALATALDGVALASIHQTLASLPIAKLSADPAWLRFIEKSEESAKSGDDSFQYYRAVPILRNTRLVGLIISFFTDNRMAGPADKKLLASWGQFASLAVERRGLYEQLSYRAEYDSLTKLLNRASLYDRLDAQIVKTRSIGGAMAVVYLDLDHFKEINDGFGHGAGDRVLQQISRRIIENVRHTDTAARIGGDEFVVILPGVSDREEASRVADLLVNAIEQPISFNGRELCVGGSVGISIYPDDGAHTDALLKKADEDMYRAKVRRRSPPSGQNAGLEADPVSALSRALLRA
jgi:diguanylate cyclase (GGDEF)-like protein